MEKKENKQQNKSWVTLVFALVICAGGIFSMPVKGGLPLGIQDMLCVVTACVLGLQGAGSVGLFITLGAVGLPVFAGLKGGTSVLMGATGGFLWGYFLAAVIAGSIMKAPTAAEKRFRPDLIIRMVIAVLVANVLIFVPALPWYARVITAQNLAAGKLAFTFSQALNTVLFPQLPFILIKAVISVALIFVLRPLMARVLFPDPKGASSTENIIRKYHEESDE